MAEREEYMLSKPAEWIDEVFKGAVVGTKAMPDLSEQFKAQFRDNIGATSSDASWQPKGYFDTFEELQATITAPKPGDAYGVGLEPPYDIWVWDGLRGRWLNNGPIKGMDGKDGEDGSDANVTKANIIAALGYTPADAKNVGVPDGSIGTDQLANGAVTKEKLDPNIDLGGLTMTKLWENASPTSDFATQTVALNLSEYSMVMVVFASGDGYDRSGCSFALVGQGGTMMTFTASSNGFTHARAFSVTTVGVEFKTGASWGFLSKDPYINTTSNNYCIPTFIYGIKGVTE